MSATNKGRGGARPGAGRKPTGIRKRLTVSLPADLSKRVRAVAEEPSQFVRIAVEARLNSEREQKPCATCGKLTKCRLDGAVLCGWHGGF